MDKSCVSNNDKIMETSITSLGNLSGTVPKDTDEGSGNGSRLAPAIGHTPYYEAMIKETAEVPWLAQPEEATFLNRTVVFNKMPIEHYANPEDNAGAETEGPIKVKEGEISITAPEEDRGYMYKCFTNIMCALIAFLIIYFIIKSIDVLF